MMGLKERKKEKTEERKQKKDSDSEQRITSTIVHFFYLDYPDCSLHPNRPFLAN